MFCDHEGAFAFDGGINSGKSRERLGKIGGSLDDGVCVGSRLGSQSFGRNTQFDFAAHGAGSRKFCGNGLRKHDFGIAEGNDKRISLTHVKIGVHHVVARYAHNGKLRLIVEEMQVMSVDCEFDIFAGFNGSTCVDTRNGIILFAVDFHIKERFVTQFFHNVNVRVDYGVGRRRNEDFLVVDIFGTDAQSNLLSDICFVDKAFCLFFGNFDLVAAERGVHLTLLAGKNSMLEEVHLRGAQERSDKLVFGAVVKELRSIDLLHDTVFHDDDTGAHGHSLGLVVSDVYKSGGKFVVKLGNLGTHLNAQFCVEVGKRLVEKEDLRLTHDCASQSHTLTLTAGKRFRLTRKQRRDTEDGCRLLYPVVDFLRSHFPQAQTERHVFVNGHVRIKSVVLEHHCDIPVLGFYVVDEFAVDVKLTGGDFLQARNHT